MSIHEEIKRRRKLAKLSQDALAARINALQPGESPITRQTIQHWEKLVDGTAPKRTRMPYVAEALGTTVEQLLSGASDSSAHGPSTATLEQALAVVAQAIGTLTAGRWDMVRARLDALPGHPEMLDDVVADALLALAAPGAPLQKRANGG